MISFRKLRLAVAQVLRLPFAATGTLQSQNFIAYANWALRDVEIIDNSGSETLRNL